MSMKRRVFVIGTTVVALIAILGTLFFLRGNNVQAASNGTGTLGALILVGDTTIGAVTQNPDQSTRTDQVRPEKDRSPQVPIASSNKNLPPPPTTNPNPTGRPVTTVNQGVSGFNGLSHLDQRNAGTGAYVNTQFSLEPPDQGLCVAKGYVMESVNNALAVYSTTGTKLAGPTANSQFFGFAPEINRTTGVTGPFISDPKCLYDNETERWYMTELMIDNGTGGSGRTYQLIAVSKSTDPTGTWKLFKFDTTDDGLNGTPSHPNCPCLGDQPLIGADHNGFYITTNEFGLASGFNGAQVYAISKTKLANAAATGGSIPPVVHIDASSYLVPFGGLSYTIQPAVRPAGGENEDGNNDNNQHGIEYFLSALQFGNPGYLVLDNRIAVWALTNTRSLNGSTPNLSIAVKVIASETYGQPNDVAQKPGPTPFGTLLGAPLEKIQSNDDRMNQVVFSNGILWSGVNTLIGDGSRTGIAYFGVKPEFDNNKLTAQMEHQGYVAVNGNSVLYPSVAVNKDGKGVIAFTLVGPDYYPSAAFAFIGDNDHQGSVHIVGAGAGPDDGFTGYAAFGGNGAGRWGDYSAAVVMPDGSVWTANEYIPAGPRTLFANWGTYVAHVSTDDNNNNDN